ncbi:LssY C-terminal domain-containing protein [Photobacterium japonica]|uniref:LssY C-terminal domain-containing protein n=1 Tax=Photobacterium japonica TaxID=2910235 RepID=UPI003D0A4A79
MHDLDWWWFFGGSFLDALIGPNIFVPGEPFLIGAGYLLSSGLIYGVVAVLLGGLLGDQLSFWIGRRFGAQGRRWLGRHIHKTRRPIAKTRLLLKKRGPLVVAAARLLGPIAWIMPFLAGSYAMAWRTFTLYSLVGLLLGVGQFVLLGYGLAQSIALLPSWDSVIIALQEHSLLLVAILVATGSCYALYRRYQWKKWGTMVLCWLIALTGANYYHFFHSQAYDMAWISSAQARMAPSAQHDDSPLMLDDLNYKVFPGLAPVYQAQPINVVYIGSHPDALMKKLGWIENKTFSNDQLTLRQYIGLITQTTPPVSDLYWNQQPQWLAYQVKGGLLKRRHIRWWYAGQEAGTQQAIWLAAISYDDNVKLAHYKGLITLLHAIDPDTDVERDTLMHNAQQQGWHTEYAPLGDIEAFSKSRHYFTDGRVAIITHPQ